MSERVSSVPRSSGRLRERRRRRRRLVAGALGVLAIVLIGVALYTLRQPAVRIASVEVFGTSLPLEEVALEEMRGYYLGIIPRDSLFFYPERAIRAGIRARYGDVAALSFFRSGLQTLTIRATTRVPIARWCGSAPAVPALPDGLASSTPQQDLYAECYLFDDQGLLYATTSEVAIVNPFLVYEALAVPEGEIRGQVLPEAEALPDAFNFARKLSEFGSPAEAIIIAAPEASIRLESGTVVQYVLEEEEAAYTALVSAKRGLNLADGSLAYVDLRFDGKVYLKRKDASVAE